MKVFSQMLGKILAARFLYHPIFIVGTGRSGTSVLLQALGTHPQILSMPGEAPLLTSIGGAAYDYALGPAKEYQRAALKVSKDYLYNCLRRLSFEIASGDNYGIKYVLKILLQSNTALLPKRHWCAKTFPTADVAQGLLQIFPKSRFIYIVRNGLHVINSRMRFHGFRDKEFDEHCHAWADAIAKYRYLLHLNCAFHIQHEELVASPDKVFRDIYSFLDIPFHPAPTDFTKGTLVHPLDAPTQRGQSIEKILEDRPAPYEDWSNERKATFKRICADAMKEAGYDLPF